MYGHVGGRMTVTSMMDSLFLCAFIFIFIFIALQLIWPTYDARKAGLRRLPGQGGACLASDLWTLERSASLVLMDVMRPTLIGPIPRI